MSEEEEDETSFSASSDSEESSSDDGDGVCGRDDDAGNDGVEPEGVRRSTRVRGLSAKALENLFGSQE